MIILITQIYSESNTTSSSYSHPPTHPEPRLMSHPAGCMSLVHYAWDLPCGEVPNNETSANDDYDLWQCHASVFSLPNTTHRSRFYSSHPPLTLDDDCSPPSSTTGSFNLIHVAVTLGDWNYIIQLSPWNARRSCCFDLSFRWQGVFRSRILLV